MRQFKFEGDTNDNVIGPIVGKRRPRYEILDEIIGGHVGALPGGEEIYLFVDVMSLLRHMFTEHGASALSRSELQRTPRQLAIEILNLAGHYRNYLMKHHQRQSTIFLYYSTKQCADKQAILPGYKENFYSKRFMGSTNPEFQLIRNYVYYNLNNVASVTKFIPNVHCIDTGLVDPEAFPAILAKEGNVDTPAIVLSTWQTDMQYALSPYMDRNSGRYWAVLNPNGEGSRLTTEWNLIHNALRKTKSGDEYIERLDYRHYQYMIAMSGDEDHSVEGIPKIGLGRAAANLWKSIEKGALPPDHCNLSSLLEEGNIKPEHHDAVSAAWRTLIHTEYAETVPSHIVAELGLQVTNFSSLGEIEKANAQYFGGGLNLELLFNGETY